MGNIDPDIDYPCTDTFCHIKGILPQYPSKTLRPLNDIDLKDPLIRVFLLDILKIIGKLPRACRQGTRTRENL